MVLTEGIKEKVKEMHTLVKMAKRLGNEICEELEQIEESLGYNDAVFDFLNDVEDAMFDSESAAVSSLENIVEDEMLELHMERN